ncbi:MAG TPA: VOC family protein [Propionicimonas sp.]|uniref:VOC family protein n=1 Tax=Propionicimonas sp. TaxID=1955623 RepID=UPI002F419A51
MAIAFNPYLNFPGNTREAFDYYQEVFGGTATFSTFGEYGAEGMPADGTMHAELKTDHFSIMACDAMPGSEEQWGGTRIYLAFMGDDLDTLKSWYDRLGEDGQIGQPLAKQVWGDLYGDVKDKFGIEWIFNISQPESSE